MTPTSSKQASDGSQTSEMTTETSNMTKIICTIGPATADVESLRRLIEAGMAVARLNGSHNTLEWHAATIGAIRAVDPTIAILFDLPGIKIRVSSPVDPVFFPSESELIFTSDARQVGENRVHVDVNRIGAAAGVGDKLILSDGMQTLQITAIAADRITCSVFGDGWVGKGTGINIPAAKHEITDLTAIDRGMLRFVADNHVDMVGLSFVESKDFVQKVRHELNESNIGLIAKIESQPGVDNLPEILREVEGILLDRGDLGSETKIERVGILQKEVISIANLFAKPVIIGTQILQSMVLNAQPTKAEVTDVTNAVLDGASALMLSAETAVGNYPIESVRMMRQIIEEVERSALRYREVPRYRPSPHVVAEDQYAAAKAIAEAIHVMTETVAISKIVCVTMTGFAAVLLSAYDLGCPILAITNSESTLRRMRLLRGVDGVLYKFRFDPQTSEHIVASLKRLWDIGKLRRDDVIAVASVMHPRRGNRMNSVSIHEVGDLVESFGWAT